MKFMNSTVALAVGLLGSLAVGYSTAAFSADNSEFGSDNVRPQFSVFANGYYDWNKGPSGSDFDGSFQGELGGLITLQPNFDIELGFAQSSDITDEKKDNTGSYKLTLKNSDLFAGVRFSIPLQNAIRFYGRGGVMYYYSNVAFEENFFNIKTGGKIKDVEEGLGFYLGGGASLELSDSLMITGELQYERRSDYFDKSSKPFDVDSWGLGVGVVWRLPER